MKTNILQTKKKLLMLFVMLVPLLASAQTKVKIDGIWYNIITKGNVAEVTFGGSSYDDRFNKYYGSITIPTTVTYEGIDYSVTSIGDFAFYGCSGLNAITFPEGVTSIGSHAFSGCSSLKSITLPEGVMSIEGWSFSDCSNLNSIILPESVTSIGSYAFSYCRSLTSINIPEGVTSIGEYAFYSCSGLNAITFPEGVTSIGDDAFYKCSSLTAVHISSIEAWCNIYFGDDFANPLYYAKNLYLNGELIKELTIPNSVTAIKDYAFRGCSSLTSIILPNGMTSIGEEAFRGCSRLTTITIPEGVTSINYNAFTDCSSLTAITLPKSVDYIGSNAFAGCSELTDVYCYAETVPSTFSNAFDGSYIEYATLHVPASAINNYKTITPWSSFGNIVTIEEVTLEKCATPTIGYENGKVVFTCDTEGATIKSNFIENIAGSYNDMEVAFIPTYTLTAYATKENYEDSDEATLTICWVPCEVNHESEETGILTIPSTPVLISARDGVLTLSGLAEGTVVTLYTTDATMVARQQSSAGEATFTVDTNQVYLVHIGDKVVKIGM